MPTEQKTQKFTVTIDRLNDRGFGEAVVWQENKKGNKRKLKLTIPHTLPGETVRVTVTEPYRRRSQATPDEIVIKHPERVIPACPHFGRCGGCMWQHWSYKGQQMHKTNMVKEYLRKHGFPSEVVQDIIGMTNPWFYRNKMEFTFAPDGSLGLHEQGNFKKIIPLETCFLMQEDMKSAVLDVAKWAKKNNLPGYDKLHHQGLLRHVMVRKSFTMNEMMIAIFATKHPDHVPEIQQLIEQIKTKHPNVKSLMWFENRDVADRAQAEASHILLGRDFIYDELMNYRYRLWYDTFFQTNPVQAEKLINLALEMAQPKSTDKMFDLFCGVGTFSLPFANRVQQLVGIEIVETSIESAKRNAHDNGINNTNFIAKDARRGIDQALEIFGAPNLLLLDPPRSGAGGKVMRRIGRTQADRIIYVSCNPKTFVADLKELVPFGYQLQMVQPVDLFPQTFHIELVACLKKVQ